MPELFDDTPFEIVESYWDQGLDWPAITETGAFDILWGDVATITDATNASPIVITTSAAHGFSSGDVVYITGVTGNLAANGYQRITVSDGTHFSLDDSEGDGAYVSDGTAQRGVAGAASAIVNGMVRVRVLAMPWNPCSGTGATPGTGVRRMVF